MPGLGYLGAAFSAVGVESMSDHLMEYSRVEVSSADSVRVPQTDYSPIGNSPSNSAGFYSFPDTFGKRLYRSRGKRVFDVAAVLLSAVLVLPLLVPLVLLVWLEGGSPIYSQIRVGRGGRRFSCLKLRSMVPDAEARLARVLATDAASAREWALSQKLTDDPRITRLGHFLRQTSLDELPQLLNVLKGDMSLVGPRPVVPDEMLRYREHVATYQAVRPGLTGIWQASGRNNISYDERVAMDVEYVGTISFGRDLRLILRTFGAVFHRTGV